MLIQTQPSQISPDQTNAIPSLSLGSVRSLVSFTLSRSPQLEVTDNTLVLVDGQSVAKSMLKNNWNHERYCKLSTDRYQSLQGKVADLVSTFCSRYNSCFGRVYFESVHYARKAHDVFADVICVGNGSSGSDEFAIITEIEAHLHVPHPYDGVIVVSDSHPFVSGSHDRTVRVLGIAKFLNLIMKEVI